ncbi:MAG: sugar transferase [Muribaculaceae bacterium]|jgi:exopolysaccharide biosynthesis polyprenyl glycosylphosphotransferase|nr:sugar transferase [Muribaculaceae bacterium]MBQ7205488.1 sugar transferase [Muribaculaceae bacterium]
MRIRLDLNNKAHQQRIKYVLGDYVMSNIAWFCYNIVRYQMGAVTGYGNLGTYLSSKMVLLGQLFFPLLMMITYIFSGYYNDVCRKSRVQELLTTMASAGINTLVIFFLALINDVIGVRGSDYEMILFLFALLFGFVYLGRFIITNNASRQIKSRQWTFPTLIVGSGSAAVAFANKLNSMRKSTGHEIKGFVNIPGENPVKGNPLPCYELDELKDVCALEDIWELIVVPSRDDIHQNMSAINKLFSLGLPILISPERFNMMQSQVRISDLYGEPLVNISRSSLSDSGKNIKRAIDIVVSILALIVLLPVYAIVACIIKSTSPGPVFYLQQRIGQHNKPFKIIKFRSMVQDAEVGGKPQLSSDDDPRITPFGHFMRKYRIDELPQFWNVLKGDMSIVGPRPERKYYIDQIIERVPAYALLHQVRPGITSMGMVKYGYAKNVDEMVERVKYDLMYLDNMSLLNDLKILIYTIKIVFTGRGM